VCVCVYVCVCVCVLVRVCVCVCVCKYERERRNVFTSLSLSKFRSVSLTKHTTTGTHPHEAPTSTVSPNATHHQLPHSLFLSLPDSFFRARALCLSNTNLESYVSTAHQPCSPHFLYLYIYVYIYKYIYIYTLLVRAFLCQTHPTHTRKHTTPRKLPQRIKTRVSQRLAGWQSKLVHITHKNAHTHTSIERQP